jgi:hypothetical protein
MKPILDGYTLSSKITVPPWDDFTITYRPALADKVYEYQASVRAVGKIRLDAMMALLDGNLLYWDLHPHPCVAASWRKLPHPILDKIADLISGYAVPEPGADEKNVPAGSEPAAISVGGSA